MTSSKNILLACASVAAVFASQPAAAQYYYYSQPYGQQSGYPYVVVQPYAQAARPYPYVIQRPQAYAPQVYAPQPRRSRAAFKPAGRHREIHREVSKADPALIEELRRKTGKKIHKTIVVREKPVVIERKRYVDDPPKIVRRHKVVDVDVPAPRQRGGGDEPGRVIHAEAEVTILGPDRMNIRLFRKGTAANAKAD